ncbi:TetR/AcrR family transcriptional regulator [Catenuloplanes indicus]|uniref:AcrR family transcriptional regulator n=1 Tax=Catenuloplanes indicus TaxID=137267 RepID=A0AAE3VT32_9ACTN|nr:TetR/AcrR family transcriptional regulator [Catenuloplanes indicus]MDQ0363778.1 AcrR family transcriptional regulator [Catenuloplanes indicus]
MTVRTRLTAAERGEQLIAAAVTAFASGGYAGTTTDQVARLAGVTQPYVIRLFGSKQRLFIAVMEHVCDRIEATFREAATQGTDVAMLGGAYIDLLAERDLLAVLLHGFGASADPEIGDVVRAGFGRIYETVRGLTGGSTEEMHAFMAEGMLCTVLSAMRLAGPDAVPAPPWAAALLAGFGMDGTGPGQ